MKVVLDIETKSFSSRFKNARTLSERRRHAPKPTLACIYLIEAGRYRYFSGKKFSDLLPVLHKADVIITFYGERFDFLVLERWCGLEQTPKFRAKSYDLWKVNADIPFCFLKKPRVKHTNLDRQGKLNFGIPRKVTGTLKEKCRAHVRLTYLLYKAFRDGTALHAVRPEHALPKVCPECGKPSELIPFQPNREGMTEGQSFDYELGHQQGMGGFARCTNRRCGRIVAWGI